MEVSAIPEYNLQDILNIAPDFIPTFLGHLRVPASNDNHGQIALKLNQLGKLKYPPLNNSLPPLINFTSPSNRFNLIYELDRLITVPETVVQEPVVDPTTFLALPPEVQQETLLYLSYPDIIRFCATSASAQSICNDDRFWKIKYEQDIWQDYPGLDKPASWKTAYGNFFRYYQDNIIWFIGNKNIESVKQALRLGIDPVYDGKIPLIYEATDANDIAILKLLLDAGAVVSINKPRNILGITSLMKAAKEGYLDIVKLLVEYGADIKLRANVKFEYSKTALLYAIKEERAKVVEYLLSLGADPNTKNSGNTTALMMAAGRGNIEIINMLLEAGAITSINQQNNAGYTALILATKNNYADTVKLLLSKGADAKLRDNKSKRAYNYAVENNYTELINILLPYSKMYESDFI